MFSFYGESNGLSEIVVMIMQATYLFVMLVRVDAEVMRSVEAS